MYLVLADVGLQLVSSSEERYCKKFQFYVPFSNQPKQSHHETHVEADKQGEFRYRRHYYKNCKPINEGPFNQFAIFIYIFLILKKK